MLHELSIIIPTLNEERYLPKLLESIRSQKFNGKLQVIIVDGKSVDQTVALAQSFKKNFKDLLVVKTHTGISHQRNTGAKKAKYKYLLFIDADIILPKNFFAKLSQKLPEGESFVLSFFLWGAEMNLLDYLSFLIFFPLFYSIGILEKVTPGGLLFITKKAHDQLGGFNEKLSLAEDIDYGLRAKKASVAYYFFFIPYGLHSPRRLRKMGRFNFWLLYVKGLYYVKRYGVHNLNKRLYYPFGHYEK